MNDIFNRREPLLINRCNPAAPTKSDTSPGRITIDIPEVLHIELRRTLQVPDMQMTSVPDLCRVVLAAYAAAPGVYQLLAEIIQADKDAMAELCALTGEAIEIPNLTVRGDKTLAAVQRAVGGLP